MNRYWLLATFVLTAAAARAGETEPLVITNADLPRETRGVSVVGTLKVTNAPQDLSWIAPIRAQFEELERLQAARAAAEIPPAPPAPPYQPRTERVRSTLIYAPWWVPRPPCINGETIDGQSCDQPFPRPRTD